MVDDEKEKRVSEIEGEKRDNIDEKKRVEEDRIRLASISRLKELKGKERSGSLPDIEK